jgi:hypothetical protein
MIIPIVIKIETLGKDSKDSKGSKQTGLLNVDVTKEEMAKYTESLKTPSKKPVDQEDEYEIMPSVVKKYYGKQWRLIDLESVEDLIGGVYPVLCGQGYCTNKSYKRGITMMVFHSIHKKKVVVANLTLNPSDKGRNESFELYEEKTDNLEHGIKQKTYLGSGSSCDPVYVYI